MQSHELDIWWSSLTIAQKERIARKGQAKAVGKENIDESLVLYPGCTRWWNALPRERQQAIHDHCIHRHSYLLKEWDDATPYGD